MSKMFQVNNIINTIILGNSLEMLKRIPSESIDMVMTSPPYWSQRDYGVDGQLGLEPTFQEYISKLCNIFDYVKRVLKKEGSCWVVIGDTYSANKNGITDRMASNRLKNNSSKIHKRVGSVKAKSLCQIPNRFAIEMIDRGWICRNEVIWHKPNCIPSSAIDRFTVDFEKLFFFTKNQKYYFNQQFEPHLTHENRPNGVVRNREYGYNSKSNAMNKKKWTLRNKRGGIKNPDYRNPKGRNKRCVWSIPTKPFAGKHSAVYPPELLVTPIQAGCPINNGIVLDPFMGAGTTGLVARGLSRNYIGIEINSFYIKIANSRLSQCNQKTLFEKEEKCYERILNQNI